MNISFEGTLYDHFHAKNTICDCTQSLVVVKYKGGPDLGFQFQQKVAVL
jgi:hypothetical protein